MPQDAAFQKRIQRIGEMIEGLDSATDPNARAMAKELVESLMALHGAALERILELATQTGEAGAALVQKCGRDDLIRSVLLLYGLHPENISARVARALEKLNSKLQSQSAHTELLSVAEDGTVVVRLSVKSAGCGSSAASIKSTVEAAILDAAPDAASIVVEESGAAFSGSGFVSLAQLQGGQATAALSAARVERSGD